MKSRTTNNRGNSRLDFGLSEKMRSRSKRAQVTIFVIIALIIIALVVLFLILKQEKVSDLGGKPEQNPESFLDLCLKDELRNVIMKIEEQGGYLEPTLYKEFMFEGDSAPSKMAYLCYYNGYCLPCVNQVPFIHKQVEKEIKADLKQKVADCIGELGQSFRDGGYTVEVRHASGDFNVNLFPDSVVININGEIVLTKSGESSVEKDFRVKQPSKISGLLDVVQRAIDDESSTLNCEFNYVDYPTLYPEYNIRKFISNDGSEIYVIEEESTREKFKFAVRGCVWPPGEGACDSEEGVLP